MIGGGALQSVHGSYWNRDRTSPPQAEYRYRRTGSPNSSQRLCGDIATQPL